MWWWADGLSLTVNTLLKLTCISRYLHKCSVIFSAHVNSFDFVVPYLRKTLIVGAESDNETTITTMIKFLLTAIQTFRLFNVSCDVQHFPMASTRAWQIVIVPALLLCAGCLVFKSNCWGIYCLKPNSDFILIYAQKHVTLLCRAGSNALLRRITRWNR